MGHESKIRTVYFTAVPLFPSNGGALCCRNHVRELARDPSLKVLVCSTGPPEHEEPNRRAFALLDVDADYMFLPFTEQDRRARSRLMARRWPFLYEADALAQPQINVAFMNEVRASSAHAVIVEYVPSASFVRSLYSTAVRRITITLNREAAFYRELRQIGRLPPDASASWIANARTCWFERWVYRNSDAVVALSDGDLPTWRGRPQIRKVMTPVFDPSSTQWHHTGAHTLFFVGNIGHYPNLQAVEWLTTQLAPELEAIGSDVEIRILGATPESVPSLWHRSNVNWLGYGDDERSQRRVCERRSVRRADRKPVWIED